jgi:hypothetical protein
VTNTDKQSILVQAIVDKMLSNSAALGIQDVFYGDQDILPRTPVITVQAGPVQKDLVQTGFTTMNTAHVFLTIYHGKIQDVQKNAKSADQLTEAVIDLLHLDKQLGGLVITGYVTTNEPGLADRGGMLKANRITWQGISKTQI